MTGQFCAFMVGTTCWAASALAITMNQVDTFETGTTLGWSEGINSPNKPSVAFGGPGGAGDRYLRDVSSGSVGAGGKMVLFNNAQWTGNYAAAGVNRIEADMINLGNTTLSMRIGLEGAFTQFASSSPVVLAPGSGWQHVVFPIEAGSLTRVVGSGQLTTVLNGLTELRILSGTTAAFSPPPIAGTLGVDNIRAVPEPVSLALVVTGALLGGRRRARQPSLRSGEKAR